MSVSEAIALAPVAVALGWVLESLLGTFGRTQL